MPAASPSVLLSLAVAVSAAVASGGRDPAAAPAAGGVESRGHSYAVVAAEGTLLDPGWKGVVEALRGKHAARVFTYARGIEGPAHPGLKGLQAALAEMRPDFVCFVALPDELAATVEVRVQAPDGRAARMPFCGIFYHEAVALMRSLGGGRFEHAQWAILTGASPADAMRVVSAEPLTVRSGLSHVGGGWLDEMESGVSFSEVNQGEKHVKAPGTPHRMVEGPQDTTGQYVQALNSNKVDMVSSSGHATEDDWELGYSYKSGRIVTASLIRRLPEPAPGKLRDLAAAPRPAGGTGRLFGLDTAGDIHPLATTNPKVYYAVGNCLIGRVSGDDCMLLGWIHHGAMQFFGHVGVQFRSCHAWGIAEYFLQLQGRFTFAEAVWLNRQALYLEESRMNEEELRHKYLCCRNSQPLPVGGRLLWETAVLYGDPAWEARLHPVREPLYDQAMERRPLPDGREEITLTATMRRECLPTRPAAFLLPPARVSDVEVRQGPRHLAVTDNLALVPFWNAGDPAPPAGKVFKALVCLKRTPVRR